MTDRSDVDVVAETDRLVIHPWHSTEADRLYDLLRRSEVVKSLGASRPMKDRAEAAHTIEAWAAELAADPRLGIWAVVQRPSGIPAGTVFLQLLPGSDGEVEIGWYLHPDSWGKGLASEAACAVLEHAFAVGLEEVWALTQPTNHRSIAVCSRIGRRLLGVTDRWFHEQKLMFWIGARRDQQPSLAPDERSPPPIADSHVLAQERDRMDGLDS